MKRILSYIGVGMLLLSVMTACEEDAALLNPDVGHDKSTVPEETVTSLGYFNSTTSYSREFGTRKSRYDRCRSRR